MQRKYKESVERQSRKEDGGTKPLTEALSPSMGAREPTVQSDRPKTPSNLARMSKSELNLSVQPPYAAANSSFTLGRPNHAMKTSQSYSATGQQQDQHTLVRQMSMPRHMTPGRTSVNSGLIDNTASPNVMQYQKSCDCPPPSRDTKYNSHSSGGSQRSLEDALQHSASHSGYNGDMPQNHNSYSGTSGSGSSAIGLSRPKPLVAPYDSGAPEVMFTPVLGNRNGPHRGSLFANNNTQPTSPDEQYDRNNIRHLVENYQRTLQQQPSISSNGSANSRLMRPASAGPGRTGSAFSIPPSASNMSQDNVYASINETSRQARSMTPGPEMRSLSVTDSGGRSSVIDSGGRSSGRMLPRTPLASSTPTSSQSNTAQTGIPQTPNSADRRKANNKIMYEYGQV